VTICVHFVGGFLCYWWRWRELST